MIAASASIARTNWSACFHWNYTQKQINLREFVESFTTKQIKELSRSNVKRKIFEWEKTLIDYIFTTIGENKSTENNPAGKNNVISDVRLQLYKSRNMCNVIIFGNRILVEFKAFYKYYWNTIFMFSNGGNWTKTLISCTQ